MALEVHGPANNPLVTFEVAFSTEYEVGETLHEGACGPIRFARNKQNGLLYAAKFITGDHMQEQERITLTRQLQILATVRHPAVLRLRGHSVDPATSDQIILTEYMPGGSLLTFPREHPDLWDLTHKFIVLLGVACGMRYIHSIGVVHRDLKPSNILLNEVGEPVIGDFGFAKLQTFSNAKIQQSRTHTVDPYAAPEILAVNDELDNKVDVYSYGMVMFHVIAGEPPYKECKNVNDLGQRVQKGISPRFPASIPIAFQRLIEDCMAHEPDDRPSFKMLVQNLLETPELYIEGIDREQVWAYAKKIMPYDFMQSSLSCEINPIDSVVERLQIVREQNEKLRALVEELEKEREGLEQRAANAKNQLSRIGDRLAGAPAPLRGRRTSALKPTASSDQLVTEGKGNKPAVKPPPRHQTQPPGQRPSPEELGIDTAKARPSADLHRSAPGRPPKGDPGAEFPLGAPNGFLHARLGNGVFNVKFLRSTNDPSHILAADPKYFVTAGGRRNWIQIKFRATVTINGIVLTPAANLCLKSWRLTATSKQSSSGLVLHTSESETGLNSANPFSLSFDPIQPLTLKIEQTGPGWTGESRFALANVAFSVPEGSAPVEIKDLLVVSNDTPTIYDPANQWVLTTHESSSAHWLRLDFLDRTLVVTGFRVRSQNPESRFVLFGCKPGADKFEEIRSTETFADSVLTVACAAATGYRYLKLQHTLRKPLAICSLEFFGTVGSLK
jgi:serine/threonine protein kinase